VNSGHSTLTAGATRVQLFADVIGIAKINCMKRIPLRMRGPLERGLFSLGSIVALTLGIPPVLVLGQPTKPTLDDYLKQLGYESVSVTARSQHNQPAVEVQLAQKKRVFLVDSGWGVTTLKESIAGPAKSLPQSGGTVEDTTSSARSGSSLVLIEKLRIGRLDFLNQPARIDKLRADFVRFPYDGVIGCDFLARNFCLLDCGRHRLYVRGGATSEEQSRALAETLRRSGYAEIPLQTDYLPTITGQANAQAIRLVVDTGAAFTILDESQIKRLGLAIIKEEAPATGTSIRQDLSANLIGIGKVGMHPVRVATLESLQIGPRIWKRVHVGVTSLENWGLAKPGSTNEPIEGLLGPDLLNRHGAVIDFSNRKLWLFPEK
jgi:predicted aspartyl protease